MSMNIYDEMIHTVKDYEDQDPKGPIAVEIAERESDQYNSIHLRIAFQAENDLPNLYDVQFRTREQLKTLWRALTKYLNGNSGLFEI